MITPIVGKLFIMAILDKISHICIYVVAHCPVGRSVGAEVTGELVDKFGCVHRWW